MGTIFDTLNAPMTVSGENIDPRYFADNGDGTYTPTPALIHNILRDSIAFYKDQIFQLDTDCTYHTEKLDEFKDTWQEKLNNEERERKYGDKIKELERRKREWRRENADKCDTRAGGPDLGDIDELKFFAGYSPEFKPSLSQAVAAYKFLYEYNKANGDTIKESIPQKPEVLMVKKEYSAEYNDLCNKWAEELGIPVVTEKVGTVTRTKYTIAQMRNANMKAVAASDDTMDEYVSGLIKYITSSNKVEFKARREECQQLIDKDFVVTFNDTVKELKAEYDGIDSKTGEDSINIYTKITDDSSAKKIIKIGRNNPNDPYKYVLNIKTDDGDLRFTKPINTKADLRKAFDMTICMLDGVDTFSAYVPDLQAIVDSL